MRAVIADQSGAPEVLHPIWLPDPERARVAVEVAAIIFIDTLIRPGKDITLIPRSAIGAKPKELFSFTECALDLAAQRTIRPPIGQKLSLDDATTAHAAIGSRTTIGKTRLRP